MKKRLAALGVLLILCCLCSIGVSAEDWDFTIRNDVLVRCTGSGEAVVIPDGVTSIGDEVFSSCDNLKSITIPNSVTSIGDSAFLFCNSLKRIDVSESNSTYSSLKGVPCWKNRDKSHHPQQRYQHWKSCFFQLHQSEEHYYPQQRHNYWRSCVLLV